MWTSDFNVLPEDIQLLVKKREDQRNNKNWEMADKVRKEIENKGWLIEDSQGKTIIKKESI